jgi:hypothetical protein
MSPLKVSAQFAAYVWYSEVTEGKATPEESLRFAEENWLPFVACAHEGWGKLLMRLANVRGAGGGEGRRVRRRLAERAQAGPIQEIAEAG